MKRGFSLIELLVVIGIIVILMVLAVPSYYFFQKQSDLTSSTEEIINTLRLAQNKALASEGASQYGVYFDQTTTPHQFILFKGGSYAARDSLFDNIHELPGSVEIYDINLGGEQEVVFNRLIGDTSQSGDISLRLINNPGETKTVYIENSGQASLASSLSPANGREKDSRHVHFDLGWSVQNATILKFYFPAFLQTEEIDMASFFDAGKTEFDWQGQFSVDGTDQEFQVHTHSLDTFNTLLCIHRSRNQGKNNQEVIIYFIDGAVEKDIAHYLADTDDTVIEAAYGGTKEIQ